MNYPRNLIAQPIISLSQKQFTGMLEIQSTTGKKWELYLRLGRLVWSKSSFHPDRAFRRNLAKYSPQIDLSQVCTITKDLQRFECYNYKILKDLIQQNLIKPEQAKALVKNKITEDLFDIFQQESIEQLYCAPQIASNSTAILESTLKTSPVLLNVEEIIEQSQQEWLLWCENGFKSCSPNLAPSLKQQEQLQQEVSEATYQNLVKLIDGNRTLRDLAFNLNKDVLMVAHSLVSYIRKGFVELVEVDDNAPILTLIQPPSHPSTPQKELNDADIPLIACIDDSPQVGQIMKQILLKMGYRCVCIQEPLQILPILIASNPSLIFLDVGMPILNGYEVVAQLQRVSKLQNIPVVMLTAQDGIFDRMRAKVVGASDFISKPVDAFKILNIVQKYLPFAEDESRNQHKSLVA